jgi:hypothetical protein
MLKTFKLKWSALVRRLKGNTYTSSDYWEERYLKGGNSGPGSYGQLATFKAEVINDLVKENQVKTVIEFGCGDGNQLMLYNFPNYLGFDVSEEAVKICKNTFSKDSTKEFKTMNSFKQENAELTLSIDVVFHLVEDAIFEAYMNTLFDSSTKIVLIYSSDFDDKPDALISWHQRNRNFSKWVERNRPDFVLKKRTPNRFPYTKDEKNSSFADFFLYERSS